MNRLLIVLALWLVPVVTWAGVYKCTENGKTVYSPFKSNPDCEEMSVSGSASQNILSPGAQGVSQDGLSLLHRARDRLKRELNSQAETAFDQGDPEVKAQQTEEAIEQGRVLVGMTKSQVVKALGKPTDIETVPDSGDKERWYYWEGSQIKHHMIFQNGSMVYYYRAP